MEDVVITGLGIVCPLGIGREAVWSAIEDRRSGIRTIPEQAEAGVPIPMGGLVPDFEPKQHVKPRKSLKVMSRETQLGFTAAKLAWADAGLEEFTYDPERLGVVCGANMFSSEIPDLMSAFGKCTIVSDAGQGQLDFPLWGQVCRQEISPLWMLKYLPNMAACHIGIAHNARGPINSIVQGDTSALHSIIEATSVVVRGVADLMIAGGTSSTVSLLDQMWHRGARMSTHVENPTEACRPFDADRDGAVASEGAALFIVESRTHAEARGACVLAKILGHGRRCEPCADTQQPTGLGVRLAIEAAIEMARIAPQDVGHVNAHGLGTREDDAIEAQAIRQVLGDVPVTAPKSFIGNSGAGSGAIELAISLLGLQQGGSGTVPPTLNYHRPDPGCPVNLVDQVQPARSPNILALNHKLTGQAVALLIEAE